MSTKKFKIWDSRFEKWIDPEDVRINAATGEVHGFRSSGNVPEWQLVQYTGLKDKNGVEIYEGDVLRWGNGYAHCSRNEVVVFKDAGFSSEGRIFNNAIRPYSESGTTYSFEVIGNIYENPELLEVG